MMSTDLEQRRQSTCKYVLIAAQPGMLGAHIDVIIAVYTQSHIIYAVILLMSLAWFYFCSVQFFCASCIVSRRHWMYGLVLHACLLSLQAGMCEPCEGSAACFALVKHVTFILLQLANHKFMLGGTSVACSSLLVPGFALWLCRCAQAALKTATDADSHGELASSVAVAIFSMCLYIPFLFLFLLLLFVSTEAQGTSDLPSQSVIPTTVGVDAMQTDVVVDHGDSCWGTCVRGQTCIRSCTEGAAGLSAAQQSSSSTTDVASSGGSIANGGHPSGISPLGHIISKQIIIGGGNSSCIARTGLVKGDSSEAVPSGENIAGTVFPTGGCSLPSAPDGAPELVAARGDPNAEPVHETDAGNLGASRDRECSVHALGGQLLWRGSFEIATPLARLHRQACSDLRLNAYTTRLVTEDGTFVTCHSTDCFYAVRRVDAQSPFRFTALVDQEEERSDPGSTGAVCEAAINFASECSSRATFDDAANDGDRLHSFWLRYTQQHVTAPVQAYGIARD